MRSAFCLTSLLFCLIIAGCRPSPQYQQQYTIPSYKWDASFRPTFTFDISDTAAAYQLFLVLRHTEAYPFSNIWLQMKTTSPEDTVGSTVRVEVPLAEPTGQWRGRGMGEIWEERAAMSTPENPVFFRRKGRYIIRLAQDMRKNPLPEVMQVGLRLEKLPVPAGKVH